MREGWLFNLCHVPQLTQESTAVFSCHIISFHCTPLFCLYFVVPPTVWVSLLTVIYVAWSTGMRPIGLSSVTWTENCPLEEVLENSGMVSLDVDQLSIVCWLISRIIQTVIGKAPRNHFPDGKQVQLPIALSRL